MKWERIEYAGIALCLIALTLMGCLALSPPAKAGNRGLLTVTLIINHYDAETGETQTYVKTGDLLLKNFAILIANTLRGADDLKSGTTTSGTSASFNPIIEVYYSSIVLGTGTTSPSPNDYKLASQVLSTTVKDHVIVKSGTAMNVTVSAVFSISGSYSITEAGIITRDDDGHEFLIARDTFPAIDVSDGDVLTVTYTFILNQG